MKNTYFERYISKKHYFSDYKPAQDLNLIVVIPCHDEPDLIGSLQSLSDCNPDFSVEVITVINASENSDEEVKSRNTDTYQKALDWCKSHADSNINFHFILENALPKKHSGVGLARKIGMDEAVRMFESIHNKDGIILCYDADCRCLPSLLSETLRHFEQNPKSPACAIHFEHPLEGKESDEIYEAIIDYELHLRYYIDMLKYSNFPYAYQTIGSSMAVRSEAYQKQGGMNKRKAGEDFYFLHKIIPLGDFTSLNSTMVVPSPRKSDRVPFGTGRAVGEWLDSDEAVFCTYSYQTFIDLKSLFNMYENWYGILDEKALKKAYEALPDSIQEFLSLDVFLGEINEVNRQSTNEEVYKKRFFQWWDGFKVLKFVHFSRDNFYPNVDVNTAVDWLFEQLDITKEESTKDKLLRLRQYDKAN